MLKKFIGWSYYNAGKQSSWSQWKLTLNIDLEHGDIQILDIIQGTQPQWHPQRRRVHPQQTEANKSYHFTSPDSTHRELHSLLPTMVLQQPKSLTGLTNWRHFRLNCQRWNKTPSMMWLWKASVIDLSFVNREATNNNIFKDWTIDNHLALNSDHNTIKFTII